MSKGSWQRPYDKKKFDDNWDKIFKDKDTEKEHEERCIDYTDYEQLERDKQDEGVS